MKKIILTHFIYFLLISLCSAKMNSEDIENLIKDYFKKENINHAFEINKKLKLPICNGKIKLEKKYKSYKTILIKCIDDFEWSYNLRTNIKTKNKKIKNSKKIKKGQGRFVYIVNSDLKKLHILTKNDILKKNIRNIGSNNYFTEKSKIIGRQLKLPLKANQILRERHLFKNWTIEEGQKVIIENNKSKISIMVDGIASESAMIGEYVEVLNKSTGKRIKAWVKNSKKVSIFR